jgi:diguanylate cyclase (GGDEF)-like protein
MRILIVDDSAEFRALVVRFLRDGGFDDIAEEASAEEAFDRIGLMNPDGSLPAPVDLILLDIDLPGASGIDACRRIKGDDRFRDVPILMVTANTDMALLQQSFEAGASDYITKPIRRGELLARLKSAGRVKLELERRKAREREILGEKRLLERANRQLERLASADALTGVANRLRFEEVYKREWARAQRTCSALSLALLDIDELKSYNDTYGHIRGDACLTAVATALESTARRGSDLVARYGGDEFAVILPGFDEERALDMARRLHRSVERLQIEQEALAAADCVTVSIGISTTIPCPNQTPKSLVAQADRALYRSKMTGRNRVTHARDMLVHTSTRVRQEIVAGCTETRTYV